MRLEISHHRVADQVVEADRKIKERCINVVTRSNKEKLRVFATNRISALSIPRRNRAFSIGPQRTLSKERPLNDRKFDWKG